MQRQIPVMPTDAVVVRCVCPSIHVTDEMIKCIRCNCYSHIGCVNARDNFICEYCRTAANEALKKEFHNVVSSDGLVVDMDVLKHLLTEEVSIVDACALREHATATAQIPVLLTQLTLHMVTVQQRLRKLENYLQNLSGDETNAEISDEIERKVEKCREAIVVLQKMSTKYIENHPGNSNLATLRDAIICDLV